MAPSTPGSRAASGSGSGYGGLGSGSVAAVRNLSHPISTAAPSTSTAATATVFAALPSCLMPEVSTGEGDFEDYLQQFTTAARLSGWQTVTT